MVIAKKGFIKNSIILLSLLMFSIGMLSRDIRLQLYVTIFPSYPEFQINNFFCNENPRCGRIAGEILGLSVTSFVNFIADVLYGNPLWQNYYLNEKEYFSVFLKYSSIIYRILCVVPILFYIKRLFSYNVKIYFLTMLAFTSFISGFPLFYLNNLFGIYLVNYDYMVVFVIGILLIHHKRIFESHFLFYSFTILCALTMENLIVIFMSVIYFQQMDLLTKIKKISLTFSIFVAVYGTLQGIIYWKNKTVLNESDGRYFVSNQAKTLEIFAAILVLLGFSVILALIVIKLNSITLSSEKVIPLIFNSDLRILTGIISGYIFSFFVGIFISGLTEFGRQFLCLPILVYLFVLLSNINRQALRT